MSADIAVIIIYSVMGLMAHAARNHPWMEWTLRVIYSFAFVAELWTAFVVLPSKDLGTELSLWSVIVTAVMATLTGLILFRPTRKGISYVLSVMNDVVSGQLFYGKWVIRHTLIAVSGASFMPRTGVAPMEVKAVPAASSTAPSNENVAEQTVKEPATAANKESEEVSEKGSIERKESPAEVAVTAAEAELEKVKADDVNVTDATVESAPDATAESAAEATAENQSDQTIALTSNPVTENPSNLTTENTPVVPTVQIEPASSAATVEPEARPKFPQPPHLVATAAPLIGAMNYKDYWLADRVFVPESFVHVNAAWIYVTVLGSLLANINLENLKVPSIGIPFPAQMDSMFSYNFLGLICLAICGCGIVVARKPGEVMKRLALVKPAGWHVGLALLMVVFTFAYDLLWSFFTGQDSGGIGPKLSMYNSGTFTAGGGASPLPAALLALATGVCAGAGEEILMRGGLQPVFGIIPAAILHGALHGQFQHAPILIIQVAGWSAAMGIVRRYTNTTTTLITHVTFNFLTTFLFAFNP